MRIGFIGAGHMAAAIARGAVSAGLAASDLTFTSLSGDSAQRLADELGARTARSNGSLAHQVDMLVLAVKPGVQPAVIEQVSHIVRDRPEMFVVSLAAGRTLDAISDDFGARVPLVRVMPNVNAQIGQSMSAICAAGASEEQIEAVASLMASVGSVARIAERDFPAFQAIAGCSPAWVFQIIEALARAGVKHGLTKAAATQFAAQSVLGSAGLVLAASRDGEIPSRLIDQVCSPGGTTIAGLLAAEDAGLSSALVAAVDAAVARDADLA
ncbi:pyrroline-5-carboxylate reductase [Actinomyces sp. B33]|uniref:pyrroline-5-carboxylate reductase n=1 Tax=Actinomyces sp. B33 TaxID=2942131 RepID=UPI00234125F7|nr:pyrroline-5-carboxylate reductase [Actinomyces sp. B33]MDC4232814.1 pyrroline-5-carboxylate reductase [Actinomyces sp. B33]